MCASYQTVLVGLNVSLHGKQSFLSYRVFTFPLRSQFLTSICRTCFPTSEFSSACCLLLSKLQHLKWLLKTWRLLLILFFCKKEKSTNICLEIVRSWRTKSLQKTAKHHGNTAPTLKIKNNNRWKSFP